MATQRCPACGLISEASAERCDCGRSFVDGSQGERRHAPAAQPKVRYALGAASVLLSIPIFFVAYWGWSYGVEAGLMLTMLGVIALGAGALLLRPRR